LECGSGLPGGVDVGFDVQSEAGEAFVGGCVGVEVEEAAVDVCVELRIVCGVKVGGFGEQQ